MIGDFARPPRYQGAGSSAVHPTCRVSVLDVIGDSGLEMTAFAPGFRRSDAEDDALRAEAAWSADVALLFLGLDEVSESEGVDHEHLRLPEVQTALLAEVAAANPRTVVVLPAGAVVEMPCLPDAAAVLHGHLAGQAWAGALLDVLTGAESPGGRLAETVPVRLADTPTAETFPGRQRAVGKTPSRTCSSPWRLRRRRGSTRRRSTSCSSWGMGAGGETLADVVTMVINAAISFWMFFPIFKVILRPVPEEPGAGGGGPDAADRLQDARRDTP